MEVLEQPVEDLSISNLLLLVVDSVIKGEPLSEETKEEMAENMALRYRILREDLDTLTQRMTHARTKGVRFREHPHLPTVMDVAKAALTRGSPVHDQLLRKVKDYDEGLAEKVQAFRSGINDRSRVDDPAFLDQMDEYRVDVSLYTRRESRGPLVMYGKKHRKGVFRLAQKPPLRIVKQMVQRVHEGQDYRYDLEDGRVEDLVGIEAVFTPDELGRRGMMDWYRYFVRSRFAWPHTQKEIPGDYHAYHIGIEVLSSPEHEHSPQDNVDLVDIHLMDLNAFIEKLLGVRNQARYAAQQRVIRDLRLSENERELIRPEDRDFVASCRRELLDFLDYSQRVGVDEL